jgi:RNA polymerase sigma-70 factor (ECF subfamily)
MGGGTIGAHASTAAITPANHEKNLEDILCRVANGDRDAFADVYHQTSAKLFRVCLRILPIRSEAEDALQDVFCTVWRNAAMFDGQRGTALIWLIKIARNRAIDQLRRSKRMTSVPIEFVDELADPCPLSFEIIAAEDEHREMLRCLDRLSARDARALRDAFFERMTYADLALAACVPVGTMKSRMRRALLQLRSAMTAVHAVGIDLP